jgi:hypothetical protein
MNGTSANYKADTGTKENIKTIETMKTKKGTKQRQPTQQ